MPPSNCTGTEVTLRSAGVLTAGIDLSYAPFAFEDAQTGDPTGFEVQLLREVAALVALKPLYVNRTTAALIPGALAHRHDLAASALRDTDELLGQACRSEAYLEADLGILVPAAEPIEIKGIGDLPERPIGVLNGSEGEAWAVSNLGDSPNVVRIGAPEDLLAELRDGRIDAIVDDLPVLLHAQTVSPEFRVVDEIDLDSRYVFATAPDNGGLMHVVDDALDQLREDGTLADLEKRWFGREV